MGISLQFKYETIHFLIKTTTVRWIAKENNDYFHYRYEAIHFPV